MADTRCPFCGAKESTDVLPEFWQCGTWFDEHDCRPSLQCKLNQIEALCREYNHPGTNLGGQAIAYRVLQIIGGYDGE